MKFFARWIAITVAVAVAAFLMPSVAIVGTTKAWVALVAFGLVLTLADMLIKPILKILSLPITILTLGIFYLFINAIVLLISSNISLALFGEGVVFSSIFSAFFASIIISLVSGAVGNVIEDK